MPGMEDDDQRPGYVIGADHSDIDTGKISRIVEAARAVTASGTGQGGPGDDESLQAALRDASADERSAAAKELTEEPDAYQATHEALRALGVEPE